MDLNSDMGEGGNFDVPLLKVVTSASVACGSHAGGGESMVQTVREAHARGVSIGAHPGYPDPEGFGRREMRLSPNRLESELVRQIARLEEACVEAGTRIRYVKPHGALYNQAATDPEVARAVVRAVLGVSPGLALLALAGSVLLNEGLRAGLPVVGEAFADRGYGPDGLLLPRNLPGALITDPTAVAERTTSIAIDGELLAIDGTRVAVEAGSICVHGDTPGAVALASVVRATLVQAGITPAAFAA